MLLVRVYQSGARICLRSGKVDVTCRNVPFGKQILFADNGLRRRLRRAVLVPARRSSPDVGEPADLGTDTGGSAFNTDTDRPLVWGGAKVTWRSCRSMRCS